MGCLNADIRLHKVLSAELIPRHVNIKVAVGVSSPLTASIRETAPPLGVSLHCIGNHPEVTARCVTKHLHTRLSIVCGVGVRGGLFDIDGLLLFDSDNEQLFESE